ncbi:MAG TPA: hypothetical protein VHO84_03760 [Syntrophorhabdaceae bacterium]|nr:hypothetical protein [Syntrophorhabdaceae bacterium]
MLRIRFSLCVKLVLLLVASLFWFNISVAAPNTGTPQSSTSGLQTSRPQITEVVKPDLPDLSLNFETVAVQPGEASVDGVTYPNKHLFFVWYVRNRGTAVSNPTLLKVSCTKEQPGSSDTTCPPGLTKDYNIYVLWPRPEDISGCQSVWNSPSIPAPEKGVTYRFVAQVNADQNVKEITYTNNILNSHYTEGGLTVSASQFRRMVNLERTAKRVTSIPADAMPQDKLKLTARTDVMPLSPKITIQSIATQPAPLKANSAFELTIQFLNAGNMTINAGQQFSLSCKVLTGGPSCPLPSGAKTINQSLQPGSIYFAKFSNISGPAGSYELTVKLIPEKPGDATKIFAVTINPEPRMQNMPASLPVKPSNTVPLKR